MEEFLWYAHYGIALILLYTIIFNGYDKRKKCRVKVPILLIILGILVFCIPVANILVLSIYIAMTSCEGEITYKSIFLKEV